MVPKASITCFQPNTSAIMLLLCFSLTFHTQRIRPFGFSQVTGKKQYCLFSLGY